jgi:Predicted periplasmic protein
MRLADRMLRALLIFLLTAVSLAHAEWTLGAKDEIATLPGGAQFIEREARDGDRAVRVLGVFFTTKQGRLAVVDNPTPERGKLGDAAKSAGAIAAVNGGYFHPNWKPVGLEIADGEKINGFERAKLLSGVFVVSNGKPRLLRSAEYKPSKADTDALQAGPFLVDDGRPTAGLNTERLARRTVVATDGKNRWAILYLTHVSLADAGAILASREVFPDFPIERALNLDGGSSSGLWVATGGSPYYLREVGTVRNYLVVKPAGE